MSRRSQVIAGAVVALLATAVVALGVAAASGWAAGEPAPGATVPGTSAGPTGWGTPPPWPVPPDVAEAVHRAGLPLLSAEGTVEHIHVHLDVLANGRPVTVPAGVGIDLPDERISPLHTHDTSGILHIESPQPAAFSLGQFFTEWGVPLTAYQMGALHAGYGETLRAYVDGSPVSGDPATIVLHAHDEIAIVFGPAAQQARVPSRYDFPAGL